MKDKKHMVIAGVAVLAVVLVVGVAAGRNLSTAKSIAKEDVKSSELTHGIHYGGNFNEFQNLTKQDSESDNVEPETEESLIKEKESLIKEMEEAKKNHPGDIYGEEGGKIRQKDDLLEGEAPALEENTEEEIDETEFTGSVDIPVYTSKGYAEHEVICDAQSQEEAESIASQISGMLLSWKNGVATIQITDSVDRFLEQYEQQGGETKFYKRFY